MNWLTKMQYEILWFGRSNSMSLISVWQLLLQDQFFLVQNLSIVCRLTDCLSNQGPVIVYEFCHTKKLTRSSCNSYTGGTRLTKKKFIHF